MGTDSRGKQSLHLAHHRRGQKRHTSNNKAGIYTYVPLTLTLTFGVLQTPIFSKYPPWYFNNSYKSYSVIGVSL